jgi:predicted restriction endonuclease
MANKYGTAWTREELVLAFHAYCQIPFAKTKAANPEVAALARILGRTPSSVARKLGNFGAFDPVLAKKGISGLRHVSRADKAIWDEFYGNWDALVRQAEQIRGTLGPVSQDAAAATLETLRMPKGDTERVGTAKQRVYQDFFRRSVLAAYNSVCCVCQCDLLPILVASHIVPWAVDKKNRLNPENGLCLCLLHDGAFDSGLITVTETFVVRVGRQAKRSNSCFVRQTILDYDGKLIQRPRRFLPGVEFLGWHRSNVFQN